MYRVFQNLRSFHGSRQHEKAEHQHDDDVHQADEQELSADLNFQTPVQQKFSPGDHIYQWRCIGLAQKHAIVMTAKDDLLIVTDFYPNRVRSKTTAPRISLNEVDQKDWCSWKKVQYDAGFLARNIHRSGTCTSVPSDFQRMVLARVRFLMDHDCNQDDDSSAAFHSIVPPYHVLKSNSECVAVWCTTGRWTTLQASSLLHSTIAGQAKSTATVAIYAANQTATVPASGIWGMLGYTTKVSLISTQPYLVPALAGYGVITLGGPLWILHRYRKHWSATTSILNNLFWSTADNEVFVDAVIEWSGIGKCGNSKRIG